MRTAFEPLTIKLKETNKLIIAIVNQKGGAGKTTLAVNLAGGLDHRSLQVTLVDTDPQGSVHQWHSSVTEQAFEVLRKAPQGINLPIHSQVVH